jgi:hypothetical protein
MQVRSVGIATDLMLAGWAATVEDHPDHRVIRSPSQPDFYYGNFILYPDAPRDGDAARWMARFDEVFGGDPRIRHKVFRWDRPDGAEGDLGGFVAAGFTVEREVILTARSVRPPPRPNREVAMRFIDGDADWDAVTRLQLEVSWEMYRSPESFSRDLVARERRLVDEGRGRWFGAFDGDLLVADLGIFVGEGLGRFQMVETRASHRGRGICGTLVHHAARIAFDALGADTLVLAADPGYHAARVYESVGFTATERLVAVMLRPPPETGS